MRTPGTFLKMSWHALRRVNFGLGDFVVCTRGKVNNLPNLQLNPGLSFTEMDIEDPEQITQWLIIFNDAFDRESGLKEFKRYVIDHKHIDVKKTLFLKNQQGELIGTTSLGVFRKNPSVGVGHYIAVRKQFQGKRLGYYMCLYCYHLLREMGVSILESETTLDRKRAIFMHFSFGFRYKHALDEWNTHNIATMLFQRSINRQLEKYYTEWKKRNASYRATRE